jgi:hypothetical protein
MLFFSQRDWEADRPCVTEFTAGAALSSLLADGRVKAIQSGRQVSAFHRSPGRRFAIPSARRSALSALPVALVADKDPWSSCTPFHGEALNEVLQVLFAQALIGAVQVHDFHKMPIRPHGPSARSLREIQGLAGMADDQPKWLLEDLTLLPFQRFDPRL